MRARSRVLLGLLGGFLLVGCGSNLPSTAPVTGTLHWEDGKPVEGASVRFVPAIQGNREASGSTNKDGEFNLSTFKHGDGAIPGDYSVVITKITSVTPPVSPTTTAPTAANKGEDLLKAMKGFSEKAKAAAKDVGEKIPAVYGDEKTTTLKFTVPSGGGKAEFKINRK